MADTLQAQPNQLLDFSTLLKNLAPTFLGSGQTTTGDTTSGGTTTTEAGAGEGIDGLLQVLQQMIPQITGTDSTNNVVQNILNQAAIAFAPQRAAENSGGIYNSTALQGLQSEAIGAATGQASQAVLAHQTAAAQIADAAAGNLTQATATKEVTTPTVTKSGTSVVAPQVNPKISGGILAALAGGGGLAKVDLTKLFSSKSDNSTLEAKQTQNDTPSGTTTQTGGFNGSSGDDPTSNQSTGNLGPSLASNDASVGQSIAPNFGLPQVGAFSNAVFSPAVNNAGSNSDFGTPGGNQPTVGPDIDLGTNTPDVGVFTPPPPPPVQAEPDIPIEAPPPPPPPPPSAPVAPPVSAQNDPGENNGGEDDGSTSSIICTYLVTQKKLDRKDWAVSAKQFQTYPSWGKQGYWAWATPVLKFMRGNERHRFTRFITMLMQLRTWHITEHKTAATYFAYIFVEVLSASCGLWLLLTKLARRVPSYIYPRIL